MCNENKQSKLIDDIMDNYNEIDDLIEHDHKLYDRALEIGYENLDEDGKRFVDNMPEHLTKLLLIQKRLRQAALEKCGVIIM